MLGVCSQKKTLQYSGIAVFFKSYCKSAKLKSYSACNPIHHLYTARTKEVKLDLIQILHLMRVDNMYIEQKKKYK